MTLVTTAILGCTSLPAVAQDADAGLSKAFKTGTPSDVRQALGSNVNVRVSLVIDGKTNHIPLLSSAVRKASSASLLRDQWLEVVRLLVDRGADVNLPDDFGFTPLIWASVPGEARVGGYFAGCLSCVSLVAAPLDSDVLQLLLLGAGAKVDLQDKNGMTALHHASIYGPLNNVESLVAKGAGLDVSDKDGNTPLMYAAGFGKWATFTSNTESVRFLIAKGANVNARNKKGQTALDRAKEGSYVAALLAANSPSLQVPDAQAHRPPDPTKALVFVYREPYSEGSARKPSVYCDDVQLVRFQNGRFFAFQIAPGMHVLKFDSPQAKGVNLEVSANRVYYIRVMNPWSGEGNYHPPADEGWFMIEHAQPHDPENIKDTTMVVRTPLWTQ